jgi:hypothetical protein
MNAKYYDGPVPRIPKNISRRLTEEAVQRSRRQAEMQEARHQELIRIEAERKKKYNEKPGPREPTKGNKRKQ